MTQPLTEATAERLDAPEILPAASNGSAAKLSLAELPELLKTELLEHAPALYVADLDGEVRWANQGFRGLEDASRRDAQGPRLLPIPEIVAEVLHVGGMIFREDMLQIGNAAQRLRSRHVPLHNGNGEIVAVAGVVQSTPDDSQRLEALAALRERLDDITRLVSDWIWETDPKLTLLNVSPRVAEALGFHPREIIGRNLLSLCDGGDDNRDEVERRFARISPFRDVGFAASTKNGDRRYFLVSAVPVFSNTTGALVGFRGTASDVTELKKREMGLRAAKEVAETASRAKTEFLANMSHELRTPLNAIIGFSEIMQMELLGAMGNQQYHGYVADIHASAQHLLGLINDILDVSKIEAGKADLLEEEIDLKQVFDSVCRLIRERGHRAGLELVVNAADDLPLLLADEQKLKQILLNLLSNAVKFTPAGGRVELTAKLDENGDLLLIVSDNGIGISPSDIARVMEPFGQVETRLNRKYEGTGLGLPLTRGLAELHGGSLTLESKLNLGTTAVVRLPARRLLRRRPEGQPAAPDRQPATV